MMGPFDTAGASIRREADLAEKRTHATVFVTDPGFVIPTILAAKQFSKSRAKHNRSDVFIIVTGFADEDVQALRDEFERFDFTFIVADRGWADFSANGSFVDSHVTKTTLLRFFIHEMIPDGYDDILYLDGDIQIVGDIGSLTALRVPEGKIAAAPDAGWLYADEPGPYATSFKTYCQGIGVLPPTSYINAGVMAFTRSSWSYWAPKALDYFLRNTELCRFHDQSALNAVLGDNRMLLSPAYNFVTDYALMGFGLPLKPKIVHFTGAAKPWQTSIPPWGTFYSRPYMLLLQEHPMLRRLLLERTPFERRSIRNQMIARIWHEAPGVRAPHNIARRWTKMRRRMENPDIQVR